MKKTMLYVGLMMVVGFVGNARATVIFSDDFTGNNGDPVDSSKWTTATSGGTVSIQGNAADLYGASDWAKAWLTSNTGANFLAPGTTTTYSGSIISLGYYPEGSLGVVNAITLNMKKSGDGNVASVWLDIPGEGTVWTGTWSGIGYGRSFSITLTPTTYAVTLDDATTTSGSLSGFHGLSSSTYTGGGKISFYSQCDGGWDTTNLLVDNVQIDSVPEPVTLAMLGLGGLAFIRRK